MRIRSEPMQELASVIGIDAVLVLVEHFGGTKLTLPKPNSQCDTAVKLGGLLSHSATQTLFRHYGGETVYIPLLSSENKAIRDARIYERYASGESVASITRSLTFVAKPCEQTVYAIINRHKMSLSQIEPQGALF